MRLVLVFLAFSFLSCATARIDTGIQTETTGNAEKIPEKKVTLLFAGDIMAHEYNTKGDFSRIYAAIKEDVSSADFSFANIEAAVNDEIPFSSYPFFNMKLSYVEAAISAGFNVLSLANNHSLDYKKPGIIRTRETFREIEKKHAAGSRPVSACGIKDSEDSGFTWRILEKNGIRILFMAVTEIVNWKYGVSLLDYIEPREPQRTEFIDEMKRIRKENPCDIFVLSLHCAEAEYVRTVDDKSEDFYNRLLDEGADILWVNHPHVARDAVLFTDAGGKVRKILYHSMGNTISGQRYKVNFKDPSWYREYTGEGIYSKVTATKDADGIRFDVNDLTLFTNIHNEDDQLVIEKFNDALIQRLEKEGRTEWAEYLGKRKKLMEYVKMTRKSLKSPAP